MKSKRRTDVAFLKRVKIPKRPAPFPTVGRMLEAACDMFEMRRLCLRQLPFDGNRDRFPFSPADVRKTTHCWHRSVEMSEGKIALARLLREHRLDRMEREILVLLVLNQLGILSRTCIQGGAELMALVASTDRTSLSVARRLSEKGRLLERRLVIVEDFAEEFHERKFFADPSLIDELVLGGASSGKGFRVRTEPEFLSRLSALTRVLDEKQESLGGRYAHAHQSHWSKASTRVDRLLRAAEETAALHPRWRISQLLSHPEVERHRGRKIIVLALLGKELGHVHAESELFRGRGLSRAAATSPELIPHALDQLRPGQGLWEAGLIQASAGEDERLSDDPRELEECEFELGPKALEILALEKRMQKRRDGSFLMREARLRLDRLVLGEGVRRALSLALAQARHAKVLVEEWGFAETVPYGRAVTLLFSGPPGVGKTACAEALAGELGRPIMVVDYSRVQNCFVGNTEKNIVSTFAAAKRSGAVLFWDEADAMFYDRNGAERSWEVRDVNVLLQELERFEGVCVLATNRAVSLDPALERRISLKVHFERPDRKAREEIWRKLLPAKMPLSRDVDVGRLAEHDLSGGEIKNAVLNAARAALARSPGGPVTMEDLAEAAEMETRGRGRTKAAVVGFR